MVENISDPIARKEAATKSSKILFGKWGGELDLTNGESKWLSDRSVAEVDWNSIHDCYGKEYILDACGIMPNHAHMVIDPLKIGEGY